MTVLARAIVTGLMLLAALVQPAAADEFLVAVASNFHATMVELGSGFEAASGHRLVAVSGSTGKHYAQIVNGAPFAAFFAADAERPARLESEGRAIPGTRFTYAVGELVLWSPEKGLADDGVETLRRGDFRHLAIANPELAPYGRAARQALESLGLWNGLAGRIVRGENVNQAFQFVHSGAARLGLVAWSQVKSAGMAGSWWRVPPDRHQPIEQQAVLLRNDAAGRDFMRWVQGENARAIIRAHGYRVPDA